MPLNLDLNVFTNVKDDFEKRQYHILGNLKSVREEFQQNRLYPWLSELIGLQRSLSILLNGFDSMRKTGPKRIKKIDLLNQRIEFESALPENLDLSAVEDLVRWAMPLIREAIEEGVTIYEFVEEHMQMENVGIQPRYQSEGYTFVPDTVQGKLHLFRYEISIFTGPDENFRSIKTTLIKTVNQHGATMSPGSLKLDLLKEFKDLPNPATFSFHTGLEFPFDHTLFPVAKRKLLRNISS